VKIKVHRFHVCTISPQLKPEIPGPEIRGYPREGKKKKGKKKEREKGRKRKKRSARARLKREDEDTHEEEDEAAPARWMEKGTAKRGGEGAMKESEFTGIQPVNTSSRIA